MDTIIEIKKSEESLNFETPSSGEVLGRFPAQLLFLKFSLLKKLDTIFGYPGGAIMPVYDALYGYQEKIKPYFSTSWGRFHSCSSVMQDLQGK